MFTIIRDEDLRGGVFAGIYMLREGDNVYIGNADADNGIKKRISCHKANIKAGRHTYFSADADVKYEILEICPDSITQDELCELEQDYWRWAKMVGFNLLNKNQDRAVSHKVADTSNMSLAQLGSGNGNARLTEEEVMEILWLKENGYRHVDIAERYRIRTNYVSCIGTQTWVHITETKKPEWATEGEDNAI